MAGVVFVAGLVDKVANGVNYFIGIKRLDEVSIRPGLETTTAAVLAVQSGDYDHRQLLPVTVLELLTTLEAVHLGQHDVQQHRIGVLVRENLKRLDAGIGRNGVKAMNSQQLALKLVHFNIVFNDHNDRPMAYGARHKNTCQSALDGAWLLSKLKDATPHYNTIRFMRVR